MERTANGKETLSWDTHSRTRFEPVHPDSSALC